MGVQLSSEVLNVSSDDLKDSFSLTCVPKIPEQSLLTSLSVSAASIPKLDSWGRSAWLDPSGLLTASSFSIFLGFSCFTTASVVTLLVKIPSLGDDYAIPSSSLRKVITVSVSLWRSEKEHSLVKALQ